MIYVTEIILNIVTEINIGIFQEPGGRVINLIFVTGINFGGNQNPPKRVRMGPAAAVGTQGMALHHSRGIEEMAANDVVSWNPSIYCPVRVSAIFVEAIWGFCSGKFRIPRKSPLDTTPRMGFNISCPR